MGTKRAGKTGGTPRFGYEETGMMKLREVWYNKVRKQRGNAETEEIKMPVKTLKKEYTVTPEMLAEHVGSGSLPVLGTPVLAALFEGAAAELAQGYLPEGVTTVGTEITVRHSAPTPCGAKITVEAELTEQTERSFRFRLRAEDEAGEIADGDHSRVSVKADKFEQKAQARRGERP